MDAEILRVDSSPLNQSNVVEPPIFHYFIAVRLKPNEQGIPEASIEWRFPATKLPKADEQVMSMVNEFCFPDSRKFPKVKISNKNKKFTFVVTSVDGLKRFGYCERHLVGEINLTNKGRRFAMCYCILSLTPQPALFDSILEISDSLSKESMMILLHKIQRMKLPLPGEKMEFSIPVLDQPEKLFRFTRPLCDQSLSGFASYDILLKHLDAFSISSIITSMLCERRIIFVSKKLSTLSSCVQACVALLYPFVWQHVFIPVLPVKMIPFVCAPVPFVVGLLELHLDALYDQADGMEEVIIVDLDNSILVPPPQDYRKVGEKYLIPFVSAIQYAKYLMDGTKTKFNIKSLINRSVSKSLHTDAEEKETVKNVLEEGYQAFIGSVLCHLKLFFRKEGFDTTEFLKYEPSLKEFLTVLLGSQLFEQFIVDETVNRLVETFSKYANDEVELKSKRLSEHKPNKSDMIIREGWLSKFGKGFRGNLVGDVGTFQHRYFRLTLDLLSYYKNNKPDTEPSGYILLNEITNIQIVEFQGHPECLQLSTLDRIYYITSNNSADLQYWYDLIQWRCDSFQGDHYQKRSASDDKITQKSKKSLRSIFTSLMSNKTTEKSHDPASGKYGEDNNKRNTMNSSKRATIDFDYQKREEEPQLRRRSHRISSVPIICPRYSDTSKTIEFIPLFKEIGSKEEIEKKDDGSHLENQQTTRKHSRFSRYGDITPKPQFFNNSKSSTD